MQINKCKNIIQIKDVIRTGQHFYIIFEYCEGGDLAGYLKKKERLSEKQVQNIMKQIANGLKQLNKLRIVHRDLKLSNFLISDDSENPTVKICDFGLARQKTSKDSSVMFNTLCGTPIYMAPEVLNGKKYDDRADLWSMGAILYELLVGKPPFQGESLKDLIDKINQGRYILPPSVKISKLCINLISGLLISDPDKRFTWDDFFEHPFITDVNEHEEEKEESEFGEISSHAISIIKNKSKEKAEILLKEGQCVLTEDGDEYEINSSERTSEVNCQYNKQIQKKSNESEEDKESNSDRNSELLALKSSDTEYNFYNSEMSKGGQSAISSNSSNFPRFKNVNKYNCSLEIVKESSNKTNEEDPDEDLKVSYEEIEYDDCKFEDQKTNTKCTNEIETREINFNNEEIFKENMINNKSKPIIQNNIIQKENSKIKLDSDILLITEFMKDLVKKSKMIISFYDDMKIQETSSYDLEIAFLLNKICYDAKTFITTFSGSKDSKDSQNLQILSNTNEKVEITEDLIRNLRNNKDYKDMKSSIVQNYLLMSNQISKTSDFFNRIDDSFKSTLASNLMKLSIDIVEEAVVLDESDLKDMAINKYIKAQFILDEILSSKFEYKNNITGSCSNSDSSDNAKILIHTPHKNSIRIVHENDLAFDCHDIKDDEIDKMYVVITNRINQYNQN